MSVLLFRILILLLPPVHANIMYTATTEEQLNKQFIFTEWLVLLFQCGIMAAAALNTALLGKQEHAVLSLTWFTPGTWLANHAFYTEGIKEKRGTFFLMVVSKTDQTVPSVSSKLKLQHLKQNKNPKKLFFLDL